MRGCSVLPRPRISCYKVNIEANNISWNEKLANANRILEKSIALCITFLSNTFVGTAVFDTPRSCCKVSKKTQLPQIPRGESFRKGTTDFDETPQ